MLEIIGGIIVIVIAYTVIGFWIDIRRFDQTRGGYEPPYEGWTGTPVNWDEMEKIPSGFRKRGLVFDTYLNCKSGEISFRIYRVIPVKFRAVSERALAVHKPREGCEKHGFTPEF